MVEKKLEAEYDQLVHACVEQGVERKMKMWKNKKLVGVMNEFKPKAPGPKGVNVFVSHKQEYVSHGKGGHNELFRWIEFVDRVLQPN